MAKRSVASLAGLGGYARHLSALLTDPPACAICGRGQASTGWWVDPIGRIHGRCPGCLGETRYQPPNPPPAGSKRFP